MITRFNMKYFLFILAILLTAGCVAKKNSTSDLVNLQSARVAVDDYYKNGRHIEDVKHIAKEGRAYIESQLSSGKYSKPAIIFDIDDTLLNNHNVFMEMQYCFSSRIWERWINMAQIPAINPMLELYTSLNSKVDIFIITGRNILQKSQTVRNLKDVGYSDWTNLFYRQKWDIEFSAMTYKSRILKQLIEKDNYQIIANFGDQESDFGVAIPGKNFKLPNYLYVTK